MQRAAVFVFFDETGVADGYATYWVEELLRTAGRVVVVANGTLTERSRRAFVELVGEADVVQRPNTGFDGWAYKAGLEHIGRDALGAYDQVILANDTCFGPVRPLATVFEEMAARRPRPDFWGLAAHPRVDEGLERFARYNPFGTVPAHIQTYFIVFDKAASTSDAFWGFWEHLPPLDTLDKAIGAAETVLTETLARAGFSWDALLPILDADADPNPTIVRAYDLLAKERFPLLKRKALIDVEGVGQARRALDWVRRSTSYDTRMIWENLLKHYGPRTLTRSLGVCRVAPQVVRHLPRVLGHMGRLARKLARGERPGRG